MKTFAKTIKSLMLATLFIGVLSLNVAPMAKTANPSIGVRVENVESANYFGEIAYAADGDTAPATDTATAGTQTPKIDVTKILQTVAVASTYVNNIFNPLIHFLTFNIGTFLGNDYIFAGAMGEMLHTIWVISRNIVNIIFVLVLLAMALKHIFMGEDSDIRKTLPKFVIMLIVVNFSWLAGKMILDASNVAANVVFAIPSGIQGIAGDALNTQIQSDPCEVFGNEVKGFCVPYKLYYPADANETYNFSEAACTEDFMKTLKDDYAKAYPLDGKPDQTAGMAKKATICWQQIKVGDYNQNNASYYLTYSMARIQNLTRANTGDQISQLAIGTMFSLIIQIVYLVAFASLYIALIARVSMLWILMAFSPFIVLLELGEGLGINGGKAKDYLSIGKFTEWAFVPAKVGAVWTVGFIMVTAGQSMGKNVFATLNASGDVQANIFSVSSLFLGMDSIQQFIWLLMTTGIIWMGTFAILGELPVIGHTIGKIGEAGSHLLHEVGHLGMQVPIIPTGHGAHGAHGHVSLSKLNPNKAIRAYANILEGGDSAKMTSAEDKFKGKVSAMVSVDFKNEDQVRSKFKEITGLSDTDIANNSEQVKAMIEKHGGDLKENKAKLIEIIMKQSHSPAAISAPIPGGDGHDAGHAAGGHADATIVEEGKSPLSGTSGMVVASAAETLKTAPTEEVKAEGVRVASATTMDVSNPVSVVPNSGPEIVNKTVEPEAVAMGLPTVETGSARLENAGLGVRPSESTLPESPIAEPVQLAQLEPTRAPETIEPDQMAKPVEQKPLEPGEPQVPV
ncbi:hypothetical protein HZA44_02400 [Candidatus Peregrinibacteria bacterium]|nr:hypothetical protein [Candidatus Peregrinibacteria bacterium]